MWSVLAQVWAPLLQRAEGLSLSTRYQTQIQQTGQLRDRDVAQLRGLTQGDLGAVPQARAVLSADTLQLFQKAAANKELEQAKALMAAGRYAEAATVIESVANGEIAKLQRSIQAAADPALARDATEHAADIQEGLRGNLGQLETAIEELAKKLPEAERATLRQALTADDPKRLLGALQQAREAHPELAGDVDGILGTKIDRGIFRTDYSLADLAAAVTAADTATAAAATVAADSVEEYRKLPPDELLKRFTALDRGWTSEDDYAEMRRMAQAADPATRERMIAQLMSGYTSGDAEACIRDILKDARGPEDQPPSDDFKKLMARVDQTRLYSELDGDMLADARRWVGQASVPGRTIPDFPHVNQFDERIDGTSVMNSCGTSSTSMVMQRFFGQQPQCQAHNIDRAIRPTLTDIFTTPSNVMRYMEDNGMRAGMQSRGSADDLRNFIDKGIPVICIMDGSNGNYDAAGVYQGNSTFSPHYVVVKGYETNPDGTIKNVILDNPGRTGGTETMPYEEFQKRWSSPGGVTNLYERAMIVGVPREGDITMPDGQTVPASSIDLPSQSPLALDAHLADLFAGIATGAVNLSADAVEGGALLANLFTNDSSDKAAADINGMSDADVQALDIHGKGGKFWNLEQCLWGVTGEEKEKAILKILRNSTPEELIQIQQNLPGGFREILSQVADGGDDERGAEILAIVARAAQSPPPGWDPQVLNKALGEALKAAGESVRAKFLEQIATASPPVELPPALLTEAQRGLDMSRYEVTHAPSGNAVLALKPEPATK